MATRKVEITLICGEYSGEVHAAHLISRLSALLNFSLQGVGGPLLKKERMELIHDYREISVTGLTEVFKKLVSLGRVYSAIKDHIKRTKPSLVVLVDFPGFNLRIAKIAKKEGIPVVYYIPPQLWAWGKWRIKNIKRYVDLVICFFPFEKVFYDFHGVRCTFVGHPYVLTVKPVYERGDFLKEFSIPDTYPIISIFPGSRENEVKRHMPYLRDSIEIIERMFENPFFVIAKASQINVEDIEGYISFRRNLRIVPNFSHDVLYHSDCAILSSGSVTLEAALLGVPSVVLYRLSTISYILGRLLVDVPYVSLPNIVLRKEVFPEFIQHVDPEKIALQVNDMLKKEKKEEMLSLRKDLTDLLRGPGRDPYENAAREIFDFLVERYGPLP